jgi:hypothetical protein
MRAQRLKRHLQGVPGYPKRGQQRESHSMHACMAADPRALHRSGIRCTGCLKRHSGYALPSRGDLIAGSVIDCSSFYTRAQLTSSTPLPSWIFLHEQVDDVEADFLRIVHGSSTRISCQQLGQQRFPGATLPSGACWSVSSSGSVCSAPATPLPKVPGVCTRRQMKAPSCQVHCLRSLIVSLSFA